MKTLARVMPTRHWRVVLGILVVGVTALATAQVRRRERPPEARQIDRYDVPNWKVDPTFPDDHFTFVRVRYGNGYRRRGGWDTDFPDSDLNFSLRLQQLTSLKVNPNPIHLALTDPELFNYPFIYLVEPGHLRFDDAEVRALRKFLLNGGFLLVDDFWGTYEFQNFYHQIKRVFPEREPQEVPLDHPIFQCVYKLDKKPQIPSIDIAVWGRTRGITWEPRRSDTSVPNYLEITDDEGRMMVFVCHNTDLGDGWEREGQNEWYFREFSVKKAYPMGINIVTYAMTH